MLRVIGICEDYGDDDATDASVHLLFKNDEDEEDEDDGDDDTTDASVHLLFKYDEDEEDDDDEDEDGSQYCQQNGPPSQALVLSSRRSRGLHGRDKSGAPFTNRDYLRSAVAPFTNMV